MHIGLYPMVRRKRRSLVQAESVPESLHNLPLVLPVLPEPPVVPVAAPQVLEKPKRKSTRAVTN